MSIASTIAKQRWNKAHYAEVKASLDKNLVCSFKTKCRDNNMSIAGVLSGFMNEYCGVSKQSKTKTVGKSARIDTRPKRRRMTAKIAVQLDSILQYEIEYRENMPANLQESIRAVSSDYSIEKLNEALEAINDAY
jgi:hypothetical protein